jgi:ArsR family transcriptional regulator
MNGPVSFGKALSDPTRVRILRLLVGSDLCVCELLDVLEVAQSSLSTHLQVLRQAGVVNAERRPPWINYSLVPDCRAPLREVFSLYEVDPIAERDAERAQLRLEMRVEGSCVYGPGTLVRELQEAKR